MDNMTRERAIQIVLELANENRISEREQEPDLVAIREEHDAAFELLESSPSLDWYRAAWETMWREGTDAECAALHDVALRTGVLWECGCGFHNPSDSVNCDDCGTGRDSQ